METGLVNIIEVMSELNVSVNAEIVSKRTVVAMALKVRSMGVTGKKEASMLKKDQYNLMLSTYLCDVGMEQMKKNDKAGLSREEYAYIKNHPIISYLMIGNLSGIDHKVKFNVLNHHRPFRGEGLNNNYPEQKAMIEKLSTYKTKYASDLSKNLLVDDISRQLKYYEEPQAQYEEDINIISIASDFASLTSKQPWREAYTSVQAMKVILNNSFFMYNDRIIRELFDRIGLSLCNNTSVINKGDYVVVAYLDSSRKYFFEICIVESIFKEQTKPILERVGTIQPIFKNVGKYVLDGFNLSTLNIDKRKAKFNLLTDPRRIIYFIDPELTPELYKTVHKEIVRFHPSLAKEELSGNE